MSKIKTIEISDNQASALKQLAALQGKTEKELIKEQFEYYFANMLEKEFRLKQQYPEDVRFTDTERVELGVSVSEKVKEIMDRRE